MDIFDICFFQLQIQRKEILDEMWILTENFIDENLDYDIECREELELLKELEWMDEFKNLLEKLNLTKKLLNLLYIEFLNEECPGGLKKDKIISLKEKFHNGIRTSEIVTVVGCSRSYARQFYLVHGKVEQKEKRKSLSQKVKKEITERDNSACVVCGEKKNLEIHHIMAIRGSSIKILDDHDNLVTLCKDCHYLAHNGNYYHHLAYKDIEGFWKWTQNTEKTKIWLILKDIEGIGLIITENIYRKFKTLDSLQKASVKNISRVDQVNLALAKRIKFKVDGLYNEQSAVNCPD